MKPLLSELFLPCSGMHSPIRANRYPLATITGAQRASGQTHSRARSHQDDADLRADRSTAYLVSCIRVRSAHGNSFEDRAVLEFFETSGRNLHAAEAAAGVGHHVALSIVGTDLTPENGYFRAKVAQEKLIKAAGIPYTIIRSTQFMEFLRGVADEATKGNIVRVSPGAFQPIAADDVAGFVADAALAPPKNGIVEIAGPERAPFSEIVARYLKAVGDPREVVSDSEARYFGGLVDDRSLVPLGEARLGRIGFAEWHRRSQARG